MVPVQITFQGEDAPHKTIHFTNIGGRLACHVAYVEGAKKLDYHAEFDAVGVGELLRCLTSTEFQNRTFTSSDAAHLEVIGPSGKGNYSHLLCLYKTDPASAPALRLTHEAIAELRVFLDNYWGAGRFARDPRSVPRFGL